MKLCTIKSFVRKKTFPAFVFVVLLIAGSGLIAASLYRTFSPDFSGKVDYDSIQPKNKRKD